VVNIFCFGYGQVAENFINELSKKNKINLSYTSRSPKNINNTHNIFELNENYFDSKIVEKSLVLYISIRNSSFFGIFERTFCFFNIGRNEFSSGFR